ncbi:RF12 [Retroperitoneal fibromatosis-associated herpesvirus]|uniref:RF12 n=1 Tax=Retroperitoneal fibromatosis-associated herpesvirus TaxID=111469 RepID=U5NM49_9GAMA|nr:RF12 [Retroperitoneal fibromatosis-associated herpesvirus]AGY30757.1 RF12 [Retroperitoneal fibromatosis-associated herpesvirus]
MADGSPTTAACGGHDPEPPSDYVVPNDSPQKTLPRIVRMPTRRLCPTPYLPVPPSVRGPSPLKASPCYTMLSPLSGPRGLTDGAPAARSPAAPEVEPVQLPQHGSPSPTAQHKLPSFHYIETPRIRPLGEGSPTPPLAASATLPAGPQTSSTGDSDAERGGDRNTQSTNPLNKPQRGRRRRVKLVRRVRIRRRGSGGSSPKNGEATDSPPTS